MDSGALQEMQERVLRAYEQQGFDRALISSWAISENDVGDLIEAAQQTNPLKILEIGTYVGVSTMLLALACPSAKLFTVDPNFELGREMRAVNSGADVNQHAPKQQEIAHRAATLLGIADRITFVEGGFSVGDTFSSVLDDESARTPVIGAALCKEHGPFDFVFVDGLHFPQAVEQDLELCAAALSPGGVIVLHDCIGFWGASVRQGIMAFLRNHPEFAFEHPPFSAVYRSIGLIRQRTGTLSAREPGTLGGDLSRNLAAFVRTAFGSERAFEIAIARPVLPAAAGGDRSFVITAKSASRDKKLSKLETALAERREKALVAFEAADFASDAVLMEVFQFAAKSGCAIFMGATPPGETGVSGPFSRPLARLNDLAGAAGLSLFLFPFADQEHARFALLPQPRALGLSSLMLTLLVAAPGDAFRDAKGRDYVRLTPALAFEAEQQALQRVHLACAFRSSLLRSNEEQTLRFAAVSELTRQLEEQTSALRAEIATLSASVEQAQALRFAAVEELTRQLNEQTAAERALRMREVGELTRQLEEQTSALRAEIATLSASVEEVQALRFAAVEELTRQLNEQTAAERALRMREVGELRREISILSGEINALRKQLEIAQASENRLRRELMETLSGFQDIEAYIKEQYRFLTPEADPDAQEPSNEAVTDTLSDALHAVRSDLKHVFQLARNAQLEAARLAHDNTKLNAQIDAVFGSLSWRVTEPLRAIRRSLKGSAGH